MMAFMGVLFQRAATPWIAGMLWAAASVQGAGAQTPTTTPPAVACPSSTEMSTPQLYGVWQLTLWPQEGGSEASPASRGAVLLERHPEYPDSVRGTLKRSTAGNDVQALVSGDVSNGDEFNLDESADGVTMDAVWEGNVTPVDCGQELRGIRRSAEGSASRDPVMHFLLKKSSGWR